MGRILIVLLLTACAVEREAKPPEPYNPEIYVVFDCGDPYHDHARPEDATLTPKWPPMVCIGGGCCR